MIQQPCRFPLGRAVAQDGVTAGRPSATLGVTVAALAPRIPNGEFCARGAHGGTLANVREFLAERERPVDEARALTPRAERSRRRYGWLPERNALTKLSLPVGTAEAVNPKGSTKRRRLAAT